MKKDTTTLNLAAIDQDRDFKLIYLADKKMWGFQVGEEPFITATSQEALLTYLSEIIPASSTKPPKENKKPT